VGAPFGLSETQGGAPTEGRPYRLRHHFKATFKLEEQARVAMVAMVDLSEDSLILR